MKTLNPLKVPFGTARWSPLRNVSFHQWEDAFAVEFEDGLSFLEPHHSIRKASRIAPDAIPASVELEPETRSGFFVHYDNGQIAEVSWAFIRELPPKKRTKTRPQTSPMKTSSCKLLAVIAALLLPLTAFAQVNSGSDGYDGALNPATNLVIDMADHPDGIYHYTSVNIPVDVTVSFIPNAGNKPVVWLVQGDCVISGIVQNSESLHMGLLEAKVVQVVGKEVSVEVMRP